MNPLAAVYARVSTLQQEQEATIDSQVAELEKYAREQGYRLAKELYFLDQAVSGAQLARPALDRLRDLAGEGEGPRFTQAGLGEGRPDACSG